MLKTAKCTCCSAVHFTSDMVATAMPNRGGRKAYMCRTCATQDRGYTHSCGTNTALQGKAKANAVGVGIELETSYTNQTARNQLFEYGFIPTFDCSLNGERTCEYVSGIMQGLNIASKLCTSLQTLIDSNQLEINGSCGTHLHISVNDMQGAGGECYMGYIRRFYNSLFTPLCEYMQAHAQETVAVFGRDFSNWAKPVNEYTNAQDRYLFVNVTNNSNIEFRLNKFTSAKQYQNLMKMQVEMVNAIITNFCEHFNRADFDTRRYDDQRAYRIHKARLTAQKLVKIFQKYANK